MDIYLRVLNTLKNKKLLSSSDSILVAAGGNYDRQIMLKANMENVVISNLEHHNDHSDYSPYEWKRLDAENIDAADNTYDWVIIHAGLHHLAVPAMGVCEMFRVARKGIICFEARDSALMKFAVKINLTSDYELEPALLSNGARGGYRNGPIPNYVYRWTEREFIKVIKSYAPSHQHEFFFDYGFAVPLQRFSMAKNPLIRATGIILSKISKLIELIIPKQGNKFAFGAVKNCSTQPWLKPDLKFDETYLSKKYDKNKRISKT